MRITSEFAYMRRLRRSLGTGGALRFRGQAIAARLGLPVRRVIKVRPTPLLWPVQLRIGTKDLDVHDQVLLRQEYGAFNDLDPRLIVDCGANVGYASAHFLSRFPAASVIAIEPFPANAEQCRRNLRPYGDRAKVLEAAVWGTDTPLVLDNVWPGHEWAVMVRPAREDEAASVRGLTIPSVTTDDIDILKIDIEGSEAELFGDTARAWLPRVRNIAIELHGERCRAVFFDRLASYRYDLSEVGELTICRRLRPR